MNSPRGSEWRRWDLHVHTKGTNKNDQFTSSDFDQFCITFFRNAIKYHICSIGITDYFSIDNYKKVINFQKNIISYDSFSAYEQRTISDMLILPNVELRMIPVTDAGRLINIHCIFNPTYVAHLENDFFNSLKYSSHSKDFSMTYDGMVQLGFQINPSITDERTAYKLGVDNFVVSHNEFKKLFANNKTLKDNTIIVVSNSNKDGVSGLQKHYDLFENDAESSLDDLRRTIYHLSDCIFSSNVNDRLYFLGEKRNKEGNGDTPDIVIQKCGSLKPCVHGSDAHTESKLFLPNDNRFCWLKADPSFEGLKQILFEPKDRVYIGEKPPLLERIENNPTKFIKRLSIQKAPDINIDEIWYGSDMSMDINPGLVSIIGNKGSGKSAIADIIGLCADAKNIKWSFLTSDKFRSPKPYNRALCFNAHLNWYDNHCSDIKNLNNDIADNMPERVKYIPQSFLEELCTTEEEAKFENEIYTIIYQYLSEEQKFGKNTLNDIIDYRSLDIKRRENEVKNKIIEKNREIILLENQYTDNCKNGIINALNLKKQELANHDNNKPLSLSEPHNEENEEDLNIRNQITDIKNHINNIDETIKLSQINLNLTVEQIHKLEVLESRINGIKSEIESLKEDYKDLNFDNFFSINYNDGYIKNKLETLYTEKNRLTLKLSSEGEDSLFLQKKELSEKVEDLERKLNEPNRLYQKYLSDLEEWSNRRKAIIGDKNTDNTVSYYEHKLSYINDILPNEVINGKEERKQLVLSLIEIKKERFQIYNSLFESVSKFIAENGNDLKDYNINLSSEFTYDLTFSDRFFDIVSRQYAGSFYGKDDAAKRLTSLQDNVDLTDSESIYLFTSNLNDSLEYDKRNEPFVKRNIDDQLRQGKSKQNLYDFIYCIDYIEPHIRLKLGGKELKALSPGERGALLLLFYLFIDKDSKPLIIDQPEENLDNESVYNYLVKFIKKAKENRQIIMVTHNPNLAVVCDSDQIIKMNIDKKHNNTVSFISGAIENPDINQAIVKILEGTYPAFHNRDSKYFCKE